MSDLEFLRTMVHRRSGLCLGDDKDYLVEARLATIARREGVGSVAQLAGPLRRGDERLADEVVDALMTNETSFFRDVHPFDAVRDEILPAFGGRPLSMWSAATATGQEAYSLAMTVAEHAPNPLTVSILASDLSRAALDRARAGRFTQTEVNRGLPARLLVKYFRRDGRDWQVDEQLRRLVTFRPINLAQPLGVPPMDVIFLRNVLIYFDAPTKQHVLHEMARVLRPGGLLFLGSAETTLGLDRAYARVQIGKAVCYRLEERNGSGNDCR